MRLERMDPVSCDVLVVGGGGAALRSAIEARRRGADVLVVSKSRVGYANNTYISAGAFAASGLGGPEDDPRIHARDTIRGGRLINDQKLVEAMAIEARAQLDFLRAIGVSFARSEGGVRIDRTPGHSQPRGVRTDPGLGRQYMIPLAREAGRIGVRRMDRVFVSRLHADGSRIAGASGIDGEGRFRTFAAKCIILATGGYAQIYRNTDNAAGITGDGQALAYELGLPLRDMEFVQFYPTGLGRLGTRAVLYEALVFRAGARLRNALGEDILVKYDLADPMKATRDRVSQALMREILEGRDIDGCVLLDLSSIPEERLGRLRPLLGARAVGETKTLRVAPTTHFCMGGVVVDERAETGIQGLFAAGEVCGGLHGANRLGGNALSEVWTMGGIAGRQAAQRAGETRSPEIPMGVIEGERQRLESTFSDRGLDPRSLAQQLRETMWTQSGIIREEGGLCSALEGIEELRSTIGEARVASPADLRNLLELENMLKVSEMVCRSALMRTESRGAHNRTDFPEQDDKTWLKNILVQKTGGEMRLGDLPVRFEVFGRDELGEAGEG